MNTIKYRDYFDIDDQYFPCVDEAAIRAGVDWKKFYPHSTFVRLLKDVERVLSRQEKRSIWIEGAYGTGKSHAALTLKKILDASDDDLKEYFDRYDLSQDLLNKYRRYKSGKIVTAHRYASGSIHGDRDLILAVQESIQQGLLDAKIEYKGENTLKESVITWLSDPLNKNYFDSLLRLDEYRILFGEMNVDDILDKLRTSPEVSELIGKIFKLADERGITALNINIDQLVKWIEDIIDKNRLTAIVLIWDEFSDYFRNNHSLTGFQKLISLCQFKPFYLMIVTHEAGHLFHEGNKEGKRVLDRYLRSEITMPENIAFDLIAAALVKKPAAQDDWNKRSDDLNSRMHDSRLAVEQTVGINSNVLKAVLPLHPMAALLLKNISSAFASNQRSMFDFIKNPDMGEVKSFQWFIDEFGPLDEQPLLTIDMLWSFFYEKGKENLSADIRSVLDTYPRHEKQLNAEERRVLKTILMMQAISQRMGDSVELFQTTEVNINLAFDGTDLETNRAVNIAKKLVRGEILYYKPLGGGKTQFASATIAGDQAQIDKIKERLRREKKTASLVDEGELATVLTLKPALRLRYEITHVTADDFTRVINGLREKPATWKLRAVIGFAKDDTEVVTLRELMRQAATDESYDLLFLDATSVPLGLEGFEQYVDYVANSEYQRKKDNQLADEMAKKAKDILRDWKNRIYNGQFVVYSYSCQSGEMSPNGQAVQNTLMNVSLKKHPLGFDAAEATETMFTPSNLKQGAECGAREDTRGTFGGAEKTITGAWKTERYWELQPALSISKIKIAIDEQIRQAFRESGRISVRDIFETLLREYGFMPCNLSAFLTGFLLKEYANGTFRYSDGEVGDPMNVEHLKVMIDECIKLYNTPNSRYKDKYIVAMTDEELEFCRLTEKVLHVPESQCASIEATTRLIRAKMKDLGFPIWCLKEIDTYDIADFIDKFTALVNPDEDNAMEIALNIGKMSKARTTAGDNLSVLITKENCHLGMTAFLKRFEDGELLRLAHAIGANNEVLSDVRRQFDAPEALWLWDQQTAEDKIRDLIVDYKVIAESNNIISRTNSLKNCLDEWRARLKFVKVSYDAVKDECPELKPLLSLLHEIANESDLTPDKRNSFQIELLTKGELLKQFINNQSVLLKKICTFYLDGLTDAEINELLCDFPTGLFVTEKTAFNRLVDERVHVFKQSQAKTKLGNLWRVKTDTKTPRDWSDKNKTPIMCLVPDSDFKSAKRAFEAINRSNSDAGEIGFATQFLENAPFLADLNRKEKRDEAFRRTVMADLAVMLPDADTVRDYLDDKLALEPYDWYPSPSTVKAKIKEFAEAKYNAGGSDIALRQIDSMNDKMLKQYLKRLVKDNMIVGIEIITSGGNWDE